MAQTTGAMSFANGYIGFSTDGSSYTNVSGSTGSIIPSGGELTIGTAYTVDGERPISKPGKYALIALTVRIVYSEVAGEAYAMAQAAYDAKSALYIRWSPGGGDAGDYGYASDEGYVTLPPYPGGNAEDGNPITQEITFSCSTITQSTIGTAGWTS